MDNGVPVTSSYELDFPEVLTPYGPMTYRADTHFCYLNLEEHKDSTIIDAWSFSVELDGLKSKYKMARNKVRDKILYDEFNHVVYRFPVSWIVKHGKPSPLEDSDILRDCEIASRYINRQQVS